MSWQTGRHDRKYKTKHHFDPRPGDPAKTPQELLVLWNEKHESYHFLFGNLNWEEAIELMKRVSRAKGRNR